MSKNGSAKPASSGNAAGFSLVEVLVAMAIGGILILGTVGLMQQVSGVQAVSQERHELLINARFAMRRMVLAVSRTRLLVLPTPDRDDNDWSEHIREQTIPPGPPEGSSTFATAVLVVTLDSAADLDGNGVPDVDNDSDGLIDEDLPADVTNDGEPGVIGLDDNGNGQADDGSGNERDDDEYIVNFSDEDPIDGIDNDDDNNIDEDPPADMNGDGAPGVLGVDDDGDGQVDEGDTADDDEDGQVDEDWLDPVAFFLTGDVLMERTPVPWDVNADTNVTGADFIDSPLAENVTRFRVERLPATSGGHVLIDLTLELTGSSGQTVSVNTRVRVGSRQ